MKRAVWLATLMWCWMGATSVQANDQDVAEMLAKHEIEYLQRLYARATDQIGTNVPENIEAGRAIYHRIFTPDATISASDPSGAGFRVVGPDEWVKVVDGALSVFDSTQHLPARRSSSTARCRRQVGEVMIASCGVAPR